MTIATQVTVVKGDNILSAWILNGVKFRITAHTDIMHDVMLAGGGLRQQPSQTTVGKGVNNRV
jgi:hypothetical protein